MPASTTSTSPSQILFYAIFALGLNMLVGYAGLVSLGHAGLFGIAAYAAAYLLLDAGYGHTAAIVGALVVTLAATAVFAVLALRAHRHRLHHDHAGARPDPLGPRLPLDQPHQRRQRHQRADAGRRRSAIVSAGASAFYYATLVVFLVAVVVDGDLRALAVRRGAAGTRDQPRRMNALGYHVWLIRFWACLFSGC